MATNIEKLIELVKKRPVIYNPKSKRFGRKNEMEKTWKEIGKEMQRDADECKNKWVNIRIAYAKHIRKKKGPPLKHKKIKSDYYLAPQLEFLRKFMRRNKRQKPSDTSESSEAESFNGSCINICESTSSSAKQSFNDSCVNIDDSSSSTLSLLEPKVEICDTRYSPEDAEFVELDFILSNLTDDETENSPCNLPKLKKCRVDISCDDQNFPLLRQLEAERRAIASKNISPTKHQETRKHSNSTEYTYESTPKLDPGTQNALNYNILPISDKHLKNRHENFNTMPPHPTETPQEKSDIIVPKCIEIKQEHINQPEIKKELTSHFELKATPPKKPQTSHEDTTVAFFEGIIPDIVKLSERGLRLFKQEILLILNKSLDEQENETSKQYSNYSNK